MQAVIKAAAREGAIVVQEMERPRPGPGQVLIEIGAASVCGSDLPIWHWAPAFHPILKPPRILGHEFAGRIVELGPDVAGWAVGDRVISESILGCGACPRCRQGRANICDNFEVRGVHRDGGMAEYAVAEQRLLHRLPDSLPFERAALVEPLSVATHAVLARSGIQAGDRALVLGPGPIGQLVAQVARAALDSVVKGGTVVLVALYSGPVELELAWVVRRELSIQATYAGTWSDFERSISFLDRGTVQVDPLIATYPLREGTRAFEDALAQRVLKPVLLNA